MLRFLEIAIVGGLIYFILAFTILKVIDQEINPIFMTGGVIASALVCALQDWWFNR